MNSELNGVIICGIAGMADELVRLAREKQLSSLSMPLIVFVEPPKSPRLSEETILQFTRQLEPPVPFFPKESASERRQPNQPFYRGLSRYQKRF